MEMEQKEAAGGGGAGGGGGGLPEDVLCRILCRLPLRTLFQLRSVCRLWRSLPFSLLFSPVPYPSPSLHHHYWLFVFRLLARKVDEHTSVDYKYTMRTWRVEYDRELLGSCPLSGSPAAAAVLAQSPLLQCLAAGTLDLVATINNGLLVFSLRVRQGTEASEEELKLFVYHPLTKALRVLPPTQWNTQKLAAMAEGTSAYNIYSLGKHLRPGTPYPLFSFEVFNSVKGGWEFLSHVSANLSGNGQLCGNNCTTLGYSNSRAVWAPPAFLYWMPTLDHREEKGLHTYLSFCNMANGYLYETPCLPFKTSFASMWPALTGVQLICGVAHPQDNPPPEASPDDADDHGTRFPLFLYPRIPRQPTRQHPRPLHDEEFHEESLGLTMAIEVWEWHHANTEEHANDDFYGCGELPRGSGWELVSRMPREVWAKFTCKEQGQGHKISCVIGHSINNSQIFLYAEGQEEHVAIYEPCQRSWSLSPCHECKTLSKLFLDKEPCYYKAIPWGIAFDPFSDAIV